MAPPNHPDADDVDVLPIELDVGTLARFATYCRMIGRGHEVARVAAEVFTDLVRDEEFSSQQALRPNVH